MCGEICVVNLAERFDAHSPERAALVVGDRVTTYDELGLRVGCWHGALVDSGLEPGDRVMLVAGNTEVFVLGYLSCLSAGLITVPVNPQAPPAELRRDIAAVDPVAVIVDGVGLDVWNEVDADRPSSIRQVFIGDGSGIDALEGGRARPPVQVDGDAPAVLLFTSGTAGSPRPAILTHDNLWSSMRSVLSLPVPLKGEDHVALAVIPLFHVFGLNLILNLGMAIGATMILEEHTSPTRTAELVRTHQVTILAGPPPLWASLAAAPDVTADDFTSVKLAVSGAAAIRPKVVAGVLDRLGVTIREGYGLTETSGVVTSSIAAEAPVGSVGQMFPGLEVRLVDSDGVDVLVGDPGEVWVRGPVVSPGYWQDPEKTAETRTDDGWLRTGDLAVVDDSGNLAIIDRMKDLIIVSGFNVHPGEVEAALLAHPAVAAAAVVGEADDATVERVVAHVVIKPDQEASQDELRTHCQSELARYKIPKRFVFTDSIPTGIAGKLRRVELQNRSS